MLRKALSGVDTSVRSIAESNGEAIKALCGPNFRSDAGPSYKMPMDRMIHVGLVNVTPDKPPHCSSCNNIGGVVPLSSEPRATHDAGQSVDEYRNELISVPIFVSNH